MHVTSCVFRLNGMYARKFDSKSIIKRSRVNPSVEDVRLTQDCSPVSLPPITNIQRQPWKETLSKAANEFIETVKNTLVDDELIESGQMVELVTPNGPQLCIIPCHYTPPGGAHIERFFNENSHLKKKSGLNVWSYIRGYLMFVCMCGVVSFPIFARSAVSGCLPDLKASPSETAQVCWLACFLCFGCLLILWVIHEILHYLKTGNTDPLKDKLKLAITSGKSKKIINGLRASGRMQRLNSHRYMRLDKARADRNYGENEGRDSRLSVLDLDDFGIIEAGFSQNSSDSSSKSAGGHHQKSNFLTETGDTESLLKGEEVEVEVGGGRFRGSQPTIGVRIGGNNSNTRFSDILGGNITLSPSSNKNNNNFNNNLAASMNFPVSLINTSSSVTSTKVNGVSSAFGHIRNFSHNRVIIGSVNSAKNLNEPMSAMTCSSNPQHNRIMSNQSNGLDFLA